MKDNLNSERRAFGQQKDDLKARMNHGDDQEIGELVDSGACLDDGCLLKSKQVDDNKMTNRSALVNIESFGDSAIGTVEGEIYRPRISTLPLRNWSHEQVLHWIMKSDFKDIAHIIKGNYF